MKVANGKVVCDVCYFRDGVNVHRTGVDVCTHADCLHTISVAEAPALAETPEKMKERLGYVMKLQERCRLVALAESVTEATSREVGEMASAMLDGFTKGKQS